MAPLALAVAILAPATADGGAAAPRGDALPEGNIVEVRIEGNVSVATEQVRAKLLSRPGHPLDQRQVEADLKTLIATKWFSDVTPYYEPDPKGKGYILTFSVKEMPVLTHVEFLGRSKIKLKDIEETTGL
jgi:outer membrane protein insertion porin family